MSVPPKTCVIANCMNTDELSLAVKSNMKLEFSGKHALIVGGTSELGIAVAKRLLDEGLKITITARNNDRMEYLQERLNARDGLPWQGAVLDLSASPEVLDGFFQTAGDDIDYLIDMAHSHFERLIASASVSDVYRYFEQNISFRAALIQRLGRTMLKRKKGRMLFISSIAAIRSNPGQGFYAASKLACEALYRSLGSELGAKGVTTVSLRPGYINAGRGREYIETLKSKGTRIAKNKVLTLNRVAETILFFLSDQAHGFNAVEIMLDGGSSAQKQET